MSKTIKINRSSVQYSIVLFSAILLSLPGAAVADKCSDILSNGIRDEYNFSSSSSIEDATYKAVCQKSFNNRSNTSSFSFNLPVPELKGIMGLGANDTYSSARRDEFCKVSSNKIDRKSAVSFAQNVINKTVVNAWEKCMSSRGLYCETENINNRHFRLKVYWEPSVRALDPRIESDLTVIGGRCLNVSRLRNGQYLREKAPVTEACERDPDNMDGQVFAYLNTSQGSVDCVIPKPVQALDPNDYLGACIAGNYEGCAGLQLQARNKHQTCMEALGPAPNDLSPAEAQQRAVIARNCGNIEGDAKAIMALIENLWQDCNQHSQLSQQCNAARQNLTMNLR